MIPQLRIGINALYLIPGEVGGTEIYLRNLLDGLSQIDRHNDYYVFTNRETDADLLPAVPNFHLISEPVRAVFRPYRLLWEQTVLPSRALSMGLDCLFNPGFTSPILAPCPTVTVFHDLQHKRHPEHFRRIDLPFWKMFLYSSALRSSRIIAVSEPTKTDLLHYYKLPEDKVRVIPLGVEDAFFKIGERSRSPGDFLLCVSTLHPHKNLERLIRAFYAFRQSQPDFRLIIAGMKGFHTAILERMAGDAVQLTGWIPREDLYNLYARAAGFIYPSTFEGFGLPILEAMAAQVPLACSAIEPLQSIAGAGALLFDPSDERAMTCAMHQLVSDGESRAHRTAAAVERAREFTWKATAVRTLAVIRETLAQ
ncbi:MAG TPA: glycosyltransferase family 1 protein [Bryobacteraceae bacterium]|nr:glycosyltransferase family 1 protein [Bryobacteraceae bacterium]